MLYQRLTIALLLFISTTCLFGNEAEEIRKLIPQQKGKELYESYIKLYQLSLEEDDLTYQLKCINDVIQMAHREKALKYECDAMMMKLVLFYNNALDDSIYEQAPQAMEFFRQSEMWLDYYEAWTLLVNLYNFTGQTTIGLKKVNEMFDDAVMRQNKYGMGMAYYAMGNVYANMYNPDEAADSYQKSIDLLMKVKPLPMQLSDIFAYYGDVLDSKKDYAQMDKLTRQWDVFLKTYFEENPQLEGEMDNRWAYYYLACAQAALGLDSLDKAGKMLEGVKQRTKNDESFINRMWLYYRADLYQKQGAYQEALALNDQSMRLTENSDDHSVLVRIRCQRAEIMEKLGRFDEAARLYREMYVINDSVNTRDIKYQLTKMNTLFQVDELKMAQVQTQYRYTLTIASIIVVALAIFSLFRYFAAKRLKAAHVKLEEAHDQLLTAYDQLEETTTAKERIESELRIARDIQKGMVPQIFPPFPKREDIDLYASMTPAKAVGGDLYDFALIGDKLYFCLGDVSGKGVPASLFMAVAVNLFRVAVHQQLMPAQIATQLNGVLAENNENGMFVTMFIGLAHLTTGRLDFCNAGHNPPVMKDKDGNVRFIEMFPNSPLGFWPGLEYEGQSIDDISMCPFFVYSDGLNEAENDRQEQLGDEHLLQVLQELTYESAEQTIKLMNTEVEKHVKGAEQSDDLTMLCLRIRGNNKVENSQETK